MLGEMINKLFQDNKKNSLQYLFIEKAENKGIYN